MIDWLLWKLSLLPPLAAFLTGAGMALAATLIPLWLVRLVWRSSEQEGKAQEWSRGSDKENFGISRDGNWE